MKTNVAKRPDPVVFAPGKTRLADIILATNNLAGMRKLVVSMNLSLDGYLSGPNRSLDWHFEYWNAVMSDILLEQLENADTILLGRTTYEAMAAYWPFKPMENNYPREDLIIADRMNRHAKIVFSKTITDRGWSNTRITRLCPEEEICLLKNQAGKNLLVLGSATLVATFIEYGLVDEYHLWIHPVILGKGNALFKNIKSPLRLDLVSSVESGSGVIIFTYRALK
jgi:dihydrofolate reductase